MVQFFFWAPKFFYPLAPPPSPALLLLLFPLVPESPRYLMVKGQRDAAEKILQRISQVNGVPLPAGQLVRLEGAWSPGP